MNPEQRIALLNELIDQIVDTLYETLASGEILSDEFQGLIAQELTATMDEIEQLKQQVSQSPMPHPSIQDREPFQGEVAPTIQEVPPSPDAQLLWILSGQNEEAFIQYLTEYPSPATQSLLRNPGELERTIEYLHAMMPPGQPPVVDGIPHADLNSSTIWGTAYNPKTGKMKVRFQGGSEYEYDGVPQNIYRAFSKGQAAAKTKGHNQYGAWWPQKNPSLGAAMNQYIKAGGFAYKRIK